LGDICKINGAEIEPVWCITGGSPCQDLSIVGKRAGLAGARSGLFMEQVRIVKEMREADKRNGRTGDMVRPRYLVWENVVGVFSSNKGKDFAVVLEEIVRIAEPGFSLSGLPEKWKWTKAGAIDGDGWSIAWRTHDAKDWGKTIRDSRTGNVIRLGTPQRRRRISVVADFGGESAAQIQFDRESVPGHPAESGAAGERPAGAAEAGASYAVRIRGGCDGGGKGALVQTEKSGTLGTGNDQTIFCLQGNGIDRDDTAGCNGKGWKADESYTLNTIDRPAVCAEVACMNPWDAQSARVYDPEGAWHSLNANESGGMARDSVLCAGFKAGQGAQAGGIGYSEEVSPTLAAAPSGTNQTPAVMAFDTTQITSKENGSQPEFGKPCHTLNANAHVPCVALDMTHACDVIRECGEQVPTLQARMGTGGNQVPLTYQMNGFGDYRVGEVASSCKQRDFKDSTDLAIANVVVRRMTPMECERLQGFPDHWTDIGEWIDGKGKRHKPSDSPRYKALGNSIALPFWDWMLRRMARYLPEGATLGSLFDGIAGYPLIWERIHGKGTARWASEIEPFPIAVTKKWFMEE
jgi:DNA (cytosine-5)-methyltransferase 1